MEGNNMKLVNFRCDDKSFKKIEDAAARRETSVTDIVKNGGVFFAGFNEEFLGFAGRMSDDLGIEIPMFIQNTVINKLAKDAAREKVWGPAEGQEPMIEFQLTNNGFITGRELFESLFESYSRQFKVKKKEADIELAGFQKLGKEIKDK